MTSIWGNGGSSTPVIPSTVVFVDTIAALRAVSKTSYSRAYVLGYYAHGDGGGGVYYYDSTDLVSADNGGSIIVATDLGRWKLVLTGKISVKQFGAKGDGVTNDLTAISNCYSVFSNCFWPNGTYSLGNGTFTPGAVFGMYGESRKGVKLTRTGAGPILSIGSGNGPFHLENIYFTGTGNTGIAGLGNANPPLTGYQIQSKIVECDFAYELAYGINGDLIYATIEKSNFGYEGTVGGKPAPGAATFVAIKSAFFPATVNYTNLNVCRDCIFNGGNAGAADVQLTSGISWRFESCDFSNGGLQLDIRDISLISFSHCWFENNTNAAGSLARLDAGSTSPDTHFYKCLFSNNTTLRLWQYASTIPTSIRVEACSIGKNAGQFCFYDNATTLTALPGAGYIAFFDNVVTGDTVGDKVRTETRFRGGAESTRLIGIIDTAGPTIVYCSDPNATVVRNAAGDITISNISHNLASATTKVMVQVSDKGGSTEQRYVIPSLTQLQIQLYNSAGAATDSIVAFEVKGA